MTECIHGLTPASCTICIHGPTPRDVELTPKTTTCRSCSASVFWGVNPKTGKRNPVNAEPAQGGNITISGWDDEGTPELTYGAKGSGPYTSHFATCEQAKDWRR